MLFMDGLNFGLMPLAEEIGHRLPKKVTLFWVLLTLFALGVATTFSEPAIGALETVGKIVDPTKAPFLYILLSHYTLALMLCVGAGVGIAAAIGALRFIYGWSLKPFIYCLIIPVMILTLVICTIIMYLFFDYYALPLHP